jgi:hypothetical protein
MSNIDFSPFEAKRRTAYDQFTAASSRNAYAKFLSKQRGDRNLTMMQGSFRKQMPKVTSGLLQRGLGGPSVRSGIADQTLNDASIDYQNTYNDAADALNQEQAGFDTNLANYTDAYNNAINDNESEKARVIRESAYSLNAFRPFLGS